MRGETLDLIINNYEQLMSLWEWSLQKLTNTQMKARIHGAISHMKKFDFFFGCRLGTTILNQTDNLSHALQKPTLSAVEAHDLALKVLAVLRKERSNESFKEFWKKLFVNKNSYALVESPVLPHKRKIPAHYNDGEDQNHHKDVELLYQQLYYNAYNYVISGIKNRFDQPDFKLYSHMQNLLLKAANSQNYLEEYNISLQARLKLLLEFVKGLNLSLSELIDSFRALPASKQSILAEAFKLIKLILVTSDTNAISERSFSALKRLETKMRSTMNNNRLNHLIVLHVYQDEIDKVHIREIANEFISRKDSRKERFSLL